MNLQDPPFFEHLVLENPWPAVIALGLVGLVLLRLGGQRGQKKPQAVGAAALVLAVVVFVVASLVTTERERLVEATRALVRHASPLELTRLKALFDARAVLTDANGQRCLDFAAIFDELSRVQGRYGVQSLKVRSLSAEVQPNGRGMTALDVRVTIDARYGSGAVPTQWLFTWSQTPDGQWRVIEARLMRVLDRPGECGIWR